MDYLKHYNSLIKTRQTLNEIRKQDRKNGGYYERHHIVPKCMGGNNDKENLILLTAREHFIAHMLLWLGYPNHKKLAHALNGMNRRSLENKINNRSWFKSSRLYEKYKLDFSLSLKEYYATNGHPSHHHRGESHWNTGRKHTKETREQGAKSRSGENHWSYGKSRDKATCNRISEKLKGRKLLEEHKQKSLKGLEKGRVIISNRDNSAYNGVTSDKNIWVHADKIYVKWFGSKKQGSRALGYIIEEIAKEFNFEPKNLRNESLLRYFRNNGNPLEDKNWVEFKNNLIIERK